MSIQYERIFPHSFSLMLLLPMNQFFDRPG
jgi:hypothetical protein